MNIRITILQFHSVPTNFLAARRNSKLLSNYEQTCIGLINLNWRIAAANIRLRKEELIPETSEMKTEIEKQKNTTLTNRLFDNLLIEFSNKKK